MRIPSFRGISFACTVTLGSLGQGILKGLLLFNRLSFSKDDCADYTQMLYNSARILHKCYENEGDIVKRIIHNINKYKLISLLVISILTVTGCASRTPVPSIRITSPIDGATIPLGDITVSVLVSNFELANKIGSLNVPGEGRIVYFLDVVPPTDPRLPVFPSQGYEYYYPSTANTHIWKDVKPGSHIFWVELVNNDLTPLYPPIVAGVTVTVVPTKTPSP